MWLFLMDVVISDSAVAIAPLALISRAFWNIWKFFEYFFFSFFFSIFSVTTKAKASVQVLLALDN